MAQDFKLVHQTLIINKVDFERKLILGIVELHLLPLAPDAHPVLRLNCRQCRIFDILVNDIHSARYDYLDPTLQIIPEDIQSSPQSLDVFKKAQDDALDSVNADKRCGELIINLPATTEMDILNMKVFRVSIEFALYDPKGGIQFVLPRMEDGALLKNAMHMFTCGTENCSRLWMPCIDAFNELCTWKIEITTDAMMTAITAGELIETKLTPDGKQKTFSYELTVPTSAANIGLVVGPFESYIDSNMNEVRHYCLPHLMPILQWTTANLYQAFEFHEELLSVRYPYASYKQVFVDEAYGDTQVYASMTIFNTNLLHSARIVDQTPASRFELAYGISQQFFGCFISRKTWHDAWLTIGISKYLSYQYLKATFGNNEYRYAIKEMLTDVCDYEQTEFPIILDASTSLEKTRAFFDISTPQTLPDKYKEVFSKKSLLVMRMLENTMGKELLLQVFNKMLSLAANSSAAEFSTGMWDNLIVSTQSFMKCVTTVTGKDIQVFIDQWVHSSGCACFYGNFIFNRKRNVVELELKQDMPGKGILRYVGPLTVTIQELDGSFNHTFKIEENKTRFEITCHSKSRRQKKKKIPLLTGEEVDMDLSAMEADSPVLWLRIDPDMQVLRKVSWEQPDFMWQYQLRHERDVIAQREALDALCDFATQPTRQALTDIIDDDHCFYRVRMGATECLITVANKMAATWTGPPAMLNIYKKMFGSYSCPNIVRQHKFKNLQQYYLQKCIPVAMAKLRNTHAICPVEVHKFVMDLFKYSDNSRNKYSDCYFTAALVEAVTHTITPAIAVAGTGEGGYSQTLSNEARLILEEITRLLNLEKLLPSYRNVITTSCLKCVRVLQQNGHLPSTATLFRSYAQYGMFIDIRIGAIEIISGFLKEGAAQIEQLEYLLDMAEFDPVPRIRHFIIQSLVKQYEAIASELNTPRLALRLWRWLNKFVAEDSRLSSEVVELYYKLYDRKKPSFAHVDEEPARVSMLNFGDVDVDDQPMVVSDTIEVMADAMDTKAHSYEEVTSESKSKLKKKKKKNKHKHKKDKKERSNDSSPYRHHHHHHHGASNQAAIVNEATLTLSEPSSPEMDL